MESAKYTTWTSLIFHPPFDALDVDDSNPSAIQHFDNDVICKIAEEYIIDYEISMYQYLKDTGLSEKFKKYLLDIDKIKKYPLPESTIKSLVDSGIDNFQVEYELIMPFIPYGNFLEYFFQFKMSSNYFIKYDPNDKKDDEPFIINDPRKPIISIDIFNKIWRNVMIILISMITEFNEHNFSHRDIKLNNIMYNPETNDFKLIDFGVSKIEPPNKYDIVTLTDMILFFLYVSITNSIIESRITDIIKKIETLLHDNKLGLLTLNGIDFKSEIFVIFDEITNLNWDGLTDLVDEPTKIFDFPLERNYKKLTFQQTMAISEMSRKNKRGGRTRINVVKYKKKSNKKMKQRRRRKSVKK
jgi:serine/threonine protein kinase